MKNTFSNLKEMKAWHISGLNGVKPPIVKCILPGCDYKSNDKNGMIGHLCTRHNKSELILAIVEIIEKGFLR